MGEEVVFWVGGWNGGEPMNGSDPTLLLTGKRMVDSLTVETRDGGSRTRMGRGMRERVGKG